MTETQMSDHQIRERHYQRLNAYRQSAEYAEYAATIGAEQPEVSPPSLLGDRWEIDQAIYGEFLDMLPPLRMTSTSFYMREFSFDDITTKFTKDGDRYFCEFARYERRAA